MTAVGPSRLDFYASSFLQKRRAAGESRQKYPSEDTRHTQILYHSIRQGEVREQLDDAKEALKRMENKRKSPRIRLFSLVMIM